MSYYSGLIHRKPNHYKNMSSTQMNDYQQLNCNNQNRQQNMYQNSYNESNQGFESRDDIDYNYNYDESDQEEEDIPLDSNYDSDSNLENKLQQNSQQLREDVNLYKNINNKKQNYHIGNEITNPMGLCPDNNGFYNSYGEYEIKYKDEEEKLNMLDIDLENNNFECSMLGSSPNIRQESLYNKVENYCSYIEENMSLAINNLKNLVLNN